MSAAKKTDPSALKINKLDMPKDVTAKHIHHFYDSQKELMEPTHLVLNFSSTSIIEHQCYPLMHKLKNHILKNGGDFSSVQISSQLLNQLQHDGVIGLFNAKQHDPTKPRKKLDADFLKTFVDSTLNTFQVQASLKLSPLPYELKTSSPGDVDIVGVVSLISKSFEGSVSICFPKKTFISVCNRLFGENHSEINSEIEDAAGELLNIIFGSAKGQLNNKYSYDIQKAIPTVIYGDKLKLKQTKGPTIVLPFQSELGSFRLEIEVVEK